MSRSTRTSPQTMNSDGVTFPAEGRARVVIEAVEPSVPGRDFAVKRVVGEAVHITADVFCDGHDEVTAVVQHRARGGEWSETAMKPLGNDRWACDVGVRSVGEHEFRVAAWVDHFKTWRHALTKRAAADQDLSVEFLIGADFVEEAAASGEAGAERLRRFADALRHAERGRESRLEVALDDRLAALMFAEGPRRHAVASPPVRIWVDRPRARFSAWYELFPRSAGDGVTHGTLRDVIRRLDRVAAMGFDVLYLPPIHPIGVSFRKGRNNTLTPGPDDVGSPWAIGGEAGGHDAVHPRLGTMDDVKALVREAGAHGIEIAMDLALQCSPDHPYVKEHPEWFRARPDGTIQYAENPPKKYQDIYPFDFECAQWRELWAEILRVVRVWIACGVKIFRVDNPHTKPFGLWEWLIAQVRRDHPDVLFLAEAFTRPKVMYRLAKLGFTQSYTYFAWRNGPNDLRDYFTELTRTSVAEFFRPNAWPNTPDILTEYLQHGGRAAFVVRAVLGATLCASWGVYGPAFELMDAAPAKPGSEEYLDSEKYQIRAWDWDRPSSLAPLLTRLNRIRRQNPALQQDRTLRFHACDNPAIVCYSKAVGENVIVVAVNTDPFAPHWGTVEIDTESLGLASDQAYGVHDLLTNTRYVWRGRRNVVGLSPGRGPAHVFRVERPQRPENFAG